MCAAQRVLRLKADQDDRVVFVLDGVPQMMANPPVLAHAACGNHHKRAFAAIEFPAFLRRVEVLHHRKMEQVAILSQRANGGRVEQFEMLGEDLGDAASQRAVHEDRHSRQRTGLHEFTQEEKHLLSAAQAEGGNHHFAVRLVGPLDDFQEPCF